MKFDLTAEELIVLEKVAAMKGNEIIAEELLVAENEVKALMKCIFLKLDVQNRLQAVLKYYL